MWFLYRAHYDSEENQGSNGKEKGEMDIREVTYSICHIWTLIFFFSSACRSTEGGIWNLGELPGLWKSAKGKIADFLQEASLNFPSSTAP